MDKLKKGILVMLVGIAMLGMMVGSVSATNDCSSYVDDCELSQCHSPTGATTTFTIGTCESGTYSGPQIGCDNGDPDVEISYVGDADRYLKEDHGYSTTAWVSSFGSSYRYDYTKKVDSAGDCRWEAVRSENNFYVTSKDGPEPNPQPKYWWPNGNDDLWNPIGCEKDTIYEWHHEC